MVKKLSKSGIKLLFALFVALAIFSFSFEAIAKENEFKQAGKDIKEGFKSLGGAIADKSKEIGSEIKSGAKQAGDDVKDGFNEVSSGVKSGVKGAGEGIQSGLDDLADAMNSKEEKKKKSK